MKAVVAPTEINSLKILTQNLFLGVHQIPPKGPKCLLRFSTNCAGPRNAALLTSDVKKLLRNCASALHRMPTERSMEHGANDRYWINAKMQMESFVFDQKQQLN